MRGALLFFYFLLAAAIGYGQGPPRIGLTLSGGGAKGLAHIGILEALDSAGLRVDYITGTSMGSIVGSLYAAGYSGKEIEKIAHDIDWGFLFSGKPSMHNVAIDEKAEFNKYALELPYESGKIRLSSGILEGQEIWLKFQELFLPVYDIKDFSQLSIPFRCIATDVSTGRAVVLDHGELVSAIRSSMAIPSVFTAMDYEDTKLVDGGVVRNFPVKDVKAMGADLVIGVNLSQGLLKAKDLRTALDILYQIGFYKDADDFIQERKLCNILIEPDLKKFSAASFSASDSIIYIGKETGLQFYPAFKRMADSLRSIYPEYAPVPRRLPNMKYLIVDDIKIAGLKHTTNISFLNRLRLEKGQRYDGVEVATAIRRVYGSQNFTRITYHWQPTSPGHAILKFEVTERPLTWLKVGFHYHSFSNVALIAGVSVKNLLIDRSKTTLKLNISENFRVLAEQNQSFGRSENNNLILSAYHERFRFPIYSNFREQYLYRSRYSSFDMKVQHTFGFNTALGIGSSLEYLGLKPKIAPIETEASNSYINSYLFFQRNTLNRREFTTSGWKIYAEAGIIHNQRPHDNFAKLDSIYGSTDRVSFKAYERVELKVEHFHPLTDRLTLLSHFNTGINLDYKNAYLNFFNVGGINDFLRNQIPFTGLNEYEVNTNSVSVAMLGFQYQVVKSLYATARVNAGLYNYIQGPTNTLRDGDFLSGYGLSIGYDSGFGPISLSAMYSDQARSVYGYVNIGFHF